MKSFFFILFLMIGPMIQAQVNNPSNLALQLTNGKTYGSYCGFAGKHPPSRINAENLIAAADVESLTSWLTSPNPVITAYAAEGLIRLFNQGIALPDAIKEQVEILKRSETLINTCKGCVYEQLTIKDGLRHFEFNN